MDDLRVHSLDIPKHISHLQLDFKKCQEYYICLKSLKCKYMVRQSKILGDIMPQNNMILTDADKISIIVNLPKPIKPRGCQVFMVHCVYYCRLVYMYA